MPSASFVLAINIAVGLLFAGGFAAVSRYDRAYRSARWFASTYLLGASAVSTEVLLVAGRFQRELYVLGFALYLASVMCIVIGLMRRYAVRPEWMALAGYFALAVGVIATTYDTPRDSLFRLFSYQVPMAGCGLISAYIIGRFAMMRPLEWTLVTALLVSAANVLAKPFIALAVGGSGASPADYAATQYAAWSQAIGGVIAIMLGVFFLVMYVLDIVGDRQQAAAIDRLSGLLGRQGFVDRVEKWLARYGARGVPCCVIVSNLDHFRLVNDTYGGAVGDNVIASFSELIKTSSGAEYILCRSQGEEFIIFAPRLRLRGAEGFTESVRADFQHVSPRGLPAEVQVTASFGVTELSPGEALEEGLQRAGRALVDAKLSGRNRVVAVPV